jgi:hypothetical protein
MSITSRINNFFKKKRLARRRADANRRTGRKLKVKGFSGLDAICHRMTNWQNSQWMRAGGPAERGADEQLVIANYYANLERKKDGIRS